MNIETLRIGIIVFLVCIMSAYYVIADKYFEKRDYDVKFQTCVKEQMHLTHTREKAGEICENKLR